MRAETNPAGGRGTCARGPAAAAASCPQNPGGRRGCGALGGGDETPPGPHARGAQGGGGRCAQGPGPAPAGRKRAGRWRGNPTAGRPCGPWPAGRPMGMAPTHRDCRADPARTPHATFLHGERGQAHGTHAATTCQTRDGASRPPILAAQARPVPAPRGEAGVGRGGLRAPARASSSPSSVPSSVKTHLHSRSRAGRPVPEDERGPDWGAQSPTPRACFPGTSRAKPLPARPHGPRQLPNSAARGAASRRRRFAASLPPEPGPERWGQALGRGARGCGAACATGEQGVRTARPPGCVAVTAPLLTRQLFLDRRTDRRAGAALSPESAAGRPGASLRRRSGRTARLRQEVHSAPSVPRATCPRFLR